MVRMTTNLGTIDIEVFADKAPIAAQNFLDYINAGYYNGLIFHRVIDKFMIQGGGFAPDLEKRDTRPPIQSEADNGLKNDRGTLSMARTNDPHSASSQFFINLKDNDFLNHTAKDPRGWGYTVFAKVVGGMDAVDKIAKVETTKAGMHDDVPKADVVIEKMEVLSQ